MPLLPSTMVWTEGSFFSAINFLSYQRSIGDQFEFLCNDWMNSALNPQSGTAVGGFDLLVGQNSADPARDRSCFLPLSPVGEGISIPTTSGISRQFVSPTGCGIFLQPIAQRAA
jgi:hypothetical protein